MVVDSYLTLPIGRLTVLDCVWGRGGELTLDCSGANACIIVRQSPRCSSRARQDGDFRDPIVSGHREGSVASFEWKKNALAHLFVRLLGCQIKEAVDELNLTKKIISCDPVPRQNSILSRSAH